MALNDDDHHHIHHSQNGMGNGRIGAVARGSVAGYTSVSMAMCGVFLLFMGSVILGMSSLSNLDDDPHFQADFFKDSRMRDRFKKKVLLIVGSIILSIAFIVIIVTVILCIYMRKKMNEARANQADSSGQLLISGSVPPPAPSGASYAMASQHPTEDTQYPQPAGYVPLSAGVARYPPTGAPTPVGNPPAQPEYPTQPGYPTSQPGNPQPEPGYTQPNADYTPPAGPGYEKPLASNPGLAPTAPSDPPPSYKSIIVNEKPPL